MNNKINVLRAVADKLSSHLIMEGKTIIKKPNAIIPGAVAAEGTVFLLETQNDSAILTVNKDGKEIQNAKFDYKETPNGYELVSVMSSYCNDNKERRQIQQNIYSIVPGQENIYEHSINYADAPIKKTTREYIDTINSFVAQTSGYKSDKTEYDSQESHTYGKKSLNRDIPVLLKLLDVIAPNAEFTLKMKDKLKKDNKTSLVAFEASNTESGEGIVKGFLSTNGDAVSYHIDVADMIIVGEQSDSIDKSNAYLKPEKIAPDQVVKRKAGRPQKVVTEQGENEKYNEPEKTMPAQVAKRKVGRPKKVVVKQAENENIDNKDADKNTSVTQKSRVRTNRINPPEYYSNMIFETATNGKHSTKIRVQIYKEILGNAYLDGYDIDDLEKILVGNGLLPFGTACKNAYIKDAIRMAENGDIKPIEKNLSDKTKELRNIEVNIDDEDLKNCVISMINEIVKMQDCSEKEATVDKALNALKKGSSADYTVDLLSFVQEASKINDDLKLHYEIYIEFVNNKKVKTLELQVKKMINNISDNHHKKRGEFLTQLYVAKDLIVLEQLQQEVQNFLNEQKTQNETEKMPEKEVSKKQSINSLASTNQKLVKKLLTCKSPKTLPLSFDEIRNLLLNMGFVECNVRGTHYKFRPPQDIFFNGEKQANLIIAYNSSKSVDPAVIDSLISVCKQYYGSEN